MRTILTLLFLPLVTPAALAANLGLIGGDVGNVAIYGDSMSNEGNPGNCEWCDPLTNAGINVWAMAQSGARTYDNFNPPTLNACDGSSDPLVELPYTGCEYFGERMTKELDGECRRIFTSAIYPEDTTRKTCIADLPRSAQTVDVFFFGANDVGNVNLFSWGLTYRDLSLGAWDVMLDASDAKGHANVIVLGPPYIRNNIVPSHDESDEVLVNLHDNLRDECSSRPRCEIADVYSAFRAVESSYGIDAMHEMYDDDCPTVECIHPGDGPTLSLGIRPNDWIGGIILNAIRRANEKRISASSFP